MAPDPIARLDQEMGFFTLIHATRGLSVLAGEARNLSIKQNQLEALLDLIAEKAETLARTSGFEV